MQKGPHAIFPEGFLAHWFCQHAEIGAFEQSVAQHGNNDGGNQHSLHRRRAAMNQRQNEWRDVRDTDESGKQQNAGVAKGIFYQNGGDGENDKQNGEQHRRPDFKRVLQRRRDNRFGIGARVFAEKYHRDANGCQCQKLPPEQWQEGRVDDPDENQNAKIHDAAGEQRGLQRAGAPFRRVLRHASGGDAHRGAGDDAAQNSRQPQAHFAAEFFGEEISDKPDRRNHDDDLPDAGWIQFERRVFPVWQHRQDDHCDQQEFQHGQKFGFVEPFDEFFDLGFFREQNGADNAQRHRHPNVGQQRQRTDDEREQRRDFTRPAAAPLFDFGKILHQDERHNRKHADRQRQVDVNSKQPAAAKAIKADE